MSIKKPKVFWPLIIDATNQTFKINDGASTWTMTINAATYLSAADLASAITTALVLGAHFPGMTCTVSATGYFSFTWNAAFTLKWATTPTVQPYILLGWFAIDAPATGGAGVFVATAPNQHTNGWYSPVAVSNDSAPIRNRDMDTVTRTVEGQTKYITEGELAERLVSFAYLPPEKFLISYAVSSFLNQALEQWWQDGRARFRYWEDATVEGTHVDYVLAQKTLASWIPVRQFTRKALYKIDLIFWGYVA